MEKEEDLTLGLRCPQILLIGPVDLGGTNQLSPSGQVIGLNGIAGRGVHYDQFVPFQKLKVRR